MADLVISARALGKRYRVGQVEHAFRRARQRFAGSSLTSHIWALNDVAFDIDAGETVAIIGRDGAGNPHSSRSSRA